MTLRILDPALSFIGVIDSYESLIWNEYYNEVGNFELYLPMTSENFQILQPDNYIIKPDTNSAMIIEDVELNSDEELGDILIITGRSLEILFERRIIDSHLNLTSSVYYGLNTLFTKFITAPTLSARKMTQIRYSIPSTGYPFNQSLYVQFFNETVLSAILAICSEFDIGYTTYITEYKTIAFQIYKGIDRSFDQDENTPIIFSSDFDNLASSIYYTSTYGSVNCAYVFGEGQGSSQKVASISDGFSDIFRREVAVDASDLSKTTSTGTITDANYIKMLQERGREYISQNQGVTSIEGTAVNTEQYKYGRDFFLGDIVQIENEYGLTAKSQITSFLYSENSSGIVQEPTFTPLF